MWTIFRRVRGCRLLWLSGTTTALSRELIEQGRPLDRAEAQTVRMHFPGYLDGCYVRPRWLLQMDAAAVTLAGEFIHVTDTTIHRCPPISKKKLERQDLWAGGCLLSLRNRIVHVTRCLLLYPY